ncbi:hypothetical protein AKO1_013749 [Acrasis kona]|uniref:Uncharacterized protein n=1 Tax=Acrasis kona TaxID=1008807 RepID=A0AAW2ZIC1_9EUKA
MALTSAQTVDTKGNPYHINASLKNDDTVQLFATSVDNGCTYQLLDVFHSTEKVPLLALIKNALSNRDSNCTCSLESVADQKCLVFRVFAPQLGSDFKMMLYEDVTKTPLSLQVSGRLDSLERAVTNIAQELNKLNTEVSKLQPTINYDKLVECFRSVMREDKTAISTSTSTSIQASPRENRAVDSLLQTVNKLSDNIARANESVRYEIGSLRLSVEGRNIVSQQFDNRPSALSSSISERLIQQIITSLEKVDEQQHDLRKELEGIADRRDEEVLLMKDLMREFKLSCKGIVEKMTDEYHDYSGLILQRDRVLKEDKIPDRSKLTLDFKSSKINSMIRITDDIIATSHDHCHIHFWDSIRGSLFKTITVTESDVVGLTLVDEDTILFGFYGSNNLKLYNWEDSECINTINTSADIRSSTHKQILIFGDERQYAVVAHRSIPVINIYNIKKKGGRLIRSLTGHTLDVNTIQFLPNGRLVSGSNDATIRVWNVDSGECCITMLGHNDWVRSLDILNERTIISGGDDGTIRTWDIETGKQIRIYGRDMGWIYDISVMDDDYFISGSKDGKLRVWSAARGECIKVLSGHRRDVTTVLVLEDKIISGSEDGTMRFWL